MRTVLISLAETSAGCAPGTLTVAGRSLAAIQVEFAALAGAEAILCYSPERADIAVPLQREADARGMKLRTVRDAHGLLGSIGAGDDLLVLDPGLVPLDKAMVDCLDTTGVIITLTADASSHGFERLDRARSWGGALTVGGRQVEQLSQLPEDADPVAALVRIAIHAGARDKALEHVPPAGRWSIIGAAEHADTLSARLLPARPQTMQPDTVLAMLIAPHLQSPARALIGFIACLALTLAAAWSGYFTAAFALAGLGALCVRVRTAVLARQRVARLTGGEGARLPAWLNLAVDAAMLAVCCTALALDRGWLESGFIAAMLVGLTRLAGLRRGSPWMGDRLALGLILAVAAASGGLAIVAMALGLLALALIVADSFRKRG